jgi:hypothetical protein
MQDQQGLQLDRVVLLGRTFEEYRRYFLLAIFAVGVSQNGAAGTRAT